MHCGAPRANDQSQPSAITYSVLMSQPVVRVTTPPSTLAAHSTATGCLAKAKGVLLVGGAVGVGGLGWLVLSILANDLRRAPDHAPRIAPFCLWLIEHRWLVPLSVLPAVVAGIWLMSMRLKSLQPKSSQRRAQPWILLAIGSLWLVLIFAAVLFAFIQFLAPLYQYQDIG